MSVQFEEIFRSVAEGKLSGEAALREFERIQNETGTRVQVRARREQDLVCFGPVWIAEELPPGSADFAALRDAGVVLFFAEDDRVQHVFETLIQRIGSRKRLVLVLPGDAFVKISADIFQVPRSDEQAFARLLREVLPDQGQTVHAAWSWRADGSGIADAVEQSLASLFALFKAVASLKSRCPIRFLCVPAASDRACLDAAVAGLGSTFQKENSRFFFRSISLDSEPPADWAANMLLREWDQLIPNSPAEARYRSGNREVRRMRALELSNAAGTLAPREGSTYLITGGLGGLGRIFAGALATDSQANVVLIGRSEPRPEHAAWLAKLDRRVLYLRADVCSEPELEAALNRARQRFGRLDGVIHAAGIIDDALVAKKSPESFSRVIAPKIRGTVALDQCTRADALEFFVLFSSLAAVSGNPGQCDYAAGNRFLDAFAGFRETMRQQGERRGRSLSINWPLWRDGGMQIPAALRELMAANWGVTPLEQRSGLRFFRAALGARQTQIGVLSVQPESFSLEKIFPGAISAGPDVRVIAQERRQTPGRTGGIRQIVTSAICEVLKVRPSDLNEDTPLDEYGVDSILLMEILQKLERDLDLVIDAAAIIDHSTINKLVRFLEAQAPVSRRANGHSPATNGHMPRNGAKELAAELPRLELQPSRIALEPAAPVVSPRRPAFEPIAVIGMACRFPGANSPEQFWDNLIHGRCLIREIPRERWNPDDYYSTDKKAPRKSYSKWAGFIENIDLFDAAYFGISEPDALGMDPQQRILLELAQELFDRCGYSRSDLKASRTGVIIGAGKSVYAGTQADYVPNDLIPHVIVNTIPNMIAGRIANFFDLRGTAETVDTACSSSLVAIHRACRMMHAGEAEMAVVGGVSLLLDPFGFIGFAKAGALAQTPVPYIFDERANGFVMGEGAGLVLLKPLSQALRDGDQIAAVICGSAVNNDGHTMGLTTPNLEAQKAVLESAYKISGVSPEAVGYLEAHGTGTLLGDPIEVKAATQVFSAITPRRQYCGLGSVKSNIGHLFHAAGVSAFMKVVLSLQHGEIPPTLHCEKPHPRFRFADSPFFPAAKQSPLPAVQGVRTSAVSSFGFGGTNCHVVVTDFAPARRPSPATRHSLPATRLSRKRYWLENPSFRKEPLPGAPAPLPTQPVLKEEPELKQTQKLQLPGKRNAPSPGPQDAAALIEQFLVKLLSESLQVDPASIDPEASFDELGFDSTSLVDIARQLETRFTLELYPTLLFEYPNIRRLSGYFAEQQAGAFLKVLQPVQDESPAPESTPSAQPADHGERNGNAPQVKVAEMARPAAADSSPGSSDLTQAIECFLKRRLAEALSVPVEQVTLETNFMEMGVDSVGLVQVAQEFEKEIGIELYPTLFFEYQNILELSRYFAREHAPAFGVYLKKTGILAEAPAPTASVAASVAAREQLAEEKKTTIQRPIRPGTPVAAVSTRDIAIIGMAGRFATADSTASFWEQLRSGAEMVREVPPTRWDHAAHFDPLRGTPGKAYCRWGSFIENADHFDASFFRVPEQEAALMDPQLRLLLETIQETADDAGCGGRLKGTRTGVYMGVCYHDYSALIRAGRPGIDPYDGTGNATTMIANRPSYFWDLRGPSLAVDTACSSSLVALHLACQALRNGECDMALAGGVNLMFSPYRYLYFCSIGALSPSGRCHSFDERADGYVPGEAVATVLLKPLDQALRDGDPIHAVIKGTAINHGGYTNTVTAPSPRLESEVLVKAWRDAGIDPETISYIEAHGTGTKLGDPVEIQGMRMAFEQFTKKRGFCAVGSAKAHLGHAEGAAGIVGVIKTVLSMKHRELPRMPHFERQNPLIRLDDSPLYIPRESIPWHPAPHQPLRAGVSSFGFGGTYGHVLLESFDREPLTAAPTGGTSPGLFLLSARSGESLQRSAARLAHWLENDAGRTDFRDVCWTFQTGREHFEERLAVVTGGAADLAQKLAAFARDGSTSEAIFRSSARTKPVPGTANPEAEKWLASERFEKLAAFWSSGGVVDWTSLYGREQRRRIHAPACAFQRQRFWFPESAHPQPAPSPGSTAVLRASISASPAIPQSAAARQSAAASEQGNASAPAVESEVFDFLRKHVADLLSMRADALDTTLPLSEQGFDSIMGMQLVKAIHQKFGITIYSGEALANPTINSLAEYLSRELSNGPSAKPSEASDRPPAVHPPTVTGGVSSRPEPVMRPVLFVLSTPRSGSTLLRVMLAGHSRIFCPPELHLLPFENMAERSRVLTGRVKFLNEGLIRAVMELRKVNAEEATAFVQDLEQRNTPTARVYSLLQDLCGDRLLVDKSPSYGEDPRVLRRAGPGQFPNGRFLFIARHPLAVMESFVRNRFDKMLGKAVENPWELAEEVWTRIHRNILEFKQTIAAERWHELRYEDLVRDPETLAKGICAFLELPFEEALLKPYEGERMTDGLHKVSLSIGDPNFLKHDRIDARLAEEWRNRVPAGLKLKEETLRIAQTLGYRAETPHLSAAQRIFLRMHREDPRWHIICRVTAGMNAGFDPDRAQSAWRSVIGNHAQLAVAFEQDPLEGWVQSEAAHSTLFTPETVDLTGASGSADVISSWISRTNAELDLRKWPLFRVAHFRREGGRVDLVCVVHHLIADGLSIATLLDDFFLFYLHGRAASRPARSFAEYCELQRKDAAHADLNLWQRHLDAEPFRLTQLAPGACSEEQETVVAWRGSDGRPLSTTFEHVAAALYKTLADLTGKTEITVAHRLHGREAGGQVFHGVAGCFAVDVPIRIPVQPAASLHEVAGAFRSLRASLPSPGYALLAADGKIALPHVITGVRLNYQPFALGQRTEGIEIIQQDVRTFQPPSHPRPYELDLIVRVRSGEAHVIVRHDRSFGSAAAQRLLATWEANLSALSA